jgi:hypothetical protein
MAKQEVVEHDNIMSRGGKRFGAMAADKTRTAGD